MSLLNTKHNKICGMTCVILSVVLSPLTWHGQKQKVDQEPTCHSNILLNSRSQNEKTHFPIYEVPIAK